MRQIASNYHCDQFIDCNNISDESTNCASNYVIIFIIFGIVTGVLISIAGLLVVFVIAFGIKWKYRRLRNASPFFLIVLLLSCGLWFSTMATWIIHHLHDCIVECQKCSHLSDIQVPNEQNENYKL